MKSHFASNLSFANHAWHQLLSGGAHLVEGIQSWPWSAMAEGISFFVFFYPLFMACTWMMGAIFYFLYWERPLRKSGDKLPELPSYPKVSILVPCYNEGPNVRETISQLAQLQYPDFEIIAINDGSKDNTLEHLMALVDEIPQLRVVNLLQNQGKAMGLRTAALVAKSEYLICIDGDALLSTDAAHWMIRHFLRYPQVGAVTGNPRIRTRSTLLGKIQVGEFSAIVGMIKRAQRVYGRIFTVSGVIAAFRKSALHEVGYWSNDMITEDIDISWKLQLAGWEIRFEPKALCWVLMPETLKGLWRQRVRWAQGGAEVLIRYFREVMQWKSRRMWLIYFECLVSIVWSYLISFSTIGWAIACLFNMQSGQSSGFWAPTWTGMLLSVTCLAQFALSLAIDARYEATIKNRGRYYYCLVWYPLVYWVINVGTSVVGSVKALTKKKGQRALWVTLDRGVVRS